MSWLDVLAGRLLHLPPATTRDVRVQKGLRIPMDDGILLTADRYFAVGGSAGPLVLIRTPYGRRGTNAMVGRAFAARGAQALIVSCRGTFGSAGDWLPMRDELPDGRATVTWVARQPWFGGSMVLAGPSYLGYTQWAIAADQPAGIAAMVPQITSSRLTLPFIRPDALDWDLLVRWNFTLEHQESRTSTVRSILRLDERRLQRAMSTLPRESVDLQLEGHRWQFFQDCLNHNSADQHWAAVDHSAAVAQSPVPVSFVGGWYDIFLPDQLRDYAAALARSPRRPDSGQPSSPAPHRLTIGPWVHGSTAGLGAAIAEGVCFALPHARGTAPAPRAPVRLYLMGTGAKGSPVPGAGLEPPAPWRDFDSWPPAGYVGTRLHLQAGGALSVKEPAATAPTGFRYDPADPTPSAGGALISVGGGPVDNRALEDRADVITFTTGPLPGDVEVIGEVFAQIFFSSDRPSADVFVRVCDVDAKGLSINVCDGIAGARRGGPTRVELWPTAYLFRRGHRIRVQVSSGAHPRYALNPGTGDPRATASKLWIADQQICHDPARPSAVLLPVAAAHRSRLH